MQSGPWLALADVPSARNALIGFAQAIRDVASKRLGGAVLRTIAEMGSQIQDNMYPEGMLLFVRKASENIPQKVEHRISFGWDVGTTVQFRWGQDYTTGLENVLQISEGLEGWDLNICVDSEEAREALIKASNVPAHLWLRGREPEGDERYITLGNRGRGRTTGMDTAMGFRISFPECLCCIRISNEHLSPEQRTTLLADLKTRVDNLATTLVADPANHALIRKPTLQFEAQVGKETVLRAQELLK